MPASKLAGGFQAQGGALMSHEIARRARRLYLTASERLRGWVDLMTSEEARLEWLEKNRRALALVKAFHRWGIHVRPCSGVIMPFETAERLLDVLAAAEEILSTREEHENPDDRS